MYLTASIARSGKDGIRERAVRLKSAGNGSVLCGCTLASFRAVIPCKPCKYQAVLIPRDIHQTANQRNFWYTPIMMDEQLYHRPTDCRPASFCRLYPHRKDFSICGPRYGSPNGLRYIQEVRVSAGVLHSFISNIIVWSHFNSFQHIVD